MKRTRKIIISSLLTILSFYVYAATPSSNVSAASAATASAPQSATAAAVNRERRGSDEIAGSLDFIVAKVEDEVITMSDIRDKFIMYQAMQKQLNKPEPEFNFATKKMIVMKSIEEMLYLLYATRNALEVTEAQVSSRVYKIKKMYRIESDEELVVYAGRSGSLGRIENLNELRDKLKQVQLIEKARQHLVSTVFKNKIPNPADEELRRFYNDNPAYFYAPESVKIQHLVIRVKEDADFDELERIEKLLKEVTKKAKAGEDFSKLVAKYADVSYRSNNGFVSNSFLKKDELSSLFPKYVKYAFKIKAGEVSPVIVDGQKRIILKITEKKSKQLKPFDEVKSNIKQYIFSQKGMKLLKKWIDEQFRRGNIKIYYDRLRVAR